MIDKHISGILIHYSDVFWLFSWGIANISQCTWYNMPNLAGQTHLANFVFQQGHLHRDDSSSGSSNGADDGEQWISRVHDHPPVGMIAWTSATATCTWNVGSVRTIAHPSRPCFRGCEHFRGPREPAVPLSLQTSGLGDERYPGGHEWRHLPLQDLPDDATQLWTWCQGNLVKTPGRLADGWRWKLHCSGKNWPDLSAKTEYHVCIKEAIAEICKVKIAPSEQLCLEKVLTTLGTEHPQANVVTKHFTLAAEASTWMLCSPDKSLPRSSLAYWPMKPLMVSGKRIPSTSHIWTCILTLGLWMDAHYWPSPGSRTLCKAYMLSSTAVLKSTGMYPSDWSIGMSANHFECGCMLLSCMGPAVRWQLHCGLLIPQTSGHRETSLRFARPLHATTTMIAYAQCDKLVVVNATTHWPLATACDVRLTTSGGPRERALGS